MVNQYYYPDHALDQKNIRPQPLTKDYADFNQAIFPLIMAFPKLDGTPLEVDLDRLATDDAYNEAVMTDFYTNRDPRFHATIFCPGMDYPCGDYIPNDMKFWNAWRKDNDGLNITLVLDEINKSMPTGANFFQMKGLDDLSVAEVYQGETDWVEIRYAEVLMNLGECANEIGETGEALQVLYDIRKRAGIQSTDGRYGITATSQSEIREAYINEWYIEFAYEGRRWDDLRRWKRFDILNKLQYRATLYPVIKDYSIVESGQFDWTKDMLDPEVRKLFRFEYIDCVDGDKNTYKFNVSLDHWFYPIKQSDLDRNSKLEQNNEWGGNFDPLK